MADTKKTTAKEREALMQKRRDADVRGLFAAYGDFGKGKKQGKTTKKK